MTFTTLPTTLAPTYGLANLHEYLTVYYTNGEVSTIRPRPPYNTLNLEVNSVKTP